MGSLAGFWVSDFFILNNRAQSVNLSELESLSQALNELLEEFPEMRRELHEQLGKLAKHEVDNAINASGLNDSNGKIRRWQEIYIGSKGGYAAVRPIYTSTGENSPGAITRYLNQGHRIRGFNKVQSGRHRRQGGGYRPRIRVSYVNGFHFYGTANITLEAKAIQLVEQFADKLANRLEGGR